MRSTLVVAVGILLVLGIFFARSRLKRAFQWGALLYAVVLVARFILFGVGDRDNLLDLLTVIAAFFLVWVVAWAATRLVLRHRERTGRPPS